MIAKFLNFLIQVHFLRFTAAEDKFKQDMRYLKLQKRLTIGALPAPIRKFKNFAYCYIQKIHILVQYLRLGYLKLGPKERVSIISCNPCMWTNSHQVQGI